MAAGVADTLGAAEDEHRATGAVAPTLSYHDGCCGLRAVRTETGADRHAAAVIALGALFNQAARTAAPAGR